jgi:hypothetical protein
MDRGGDEAGAGDASSTARRPAAPIPLSQKRYKKIGAAINPLSIANC